MDCYVYCWTNELNGKRYVGMGRGRRAERHREPSSKSLVSAAMRKYGISAFALEYLRTGLTPLEAQAIEIAEIARLNSMRPAGYNLTAGGEGLKNIRHTAQHRARLSAAGGQLLTAAQETNVRIMRSLGAKQRHIAEWFGTSQQRIQKYLARPQLRQV